MSMAAGRLEAGVNAAPLRQSRPVVYPSVVWKSTSEHCKLRRRVHLKRQCAGQSGRLGIKCSRRSASKLSIMRGDQTVGESTSAVLPVKQGLLDGRFILEGQYADLPRCVGAQTLRGASLLRRDALAVPATPHRWLILSAPRRASACRARSVRLPRIL